MVKTALTLPGLPGGGASTAGVFTRPKRQTGFTIVELMVVVVIVAVMLGLGVPLFQNFITDQRMRATGSDLRIGLTLARSEAIKRNTIIELKPYDDGWAEGWTIPNPVDGDPDILNHVQPGEVSITGPDTVQFNPMGRVVAPAPEFEIEIGPEKSCLEVALDGRVDSEPGACPIGG